MLLTCPPPPKKDAVALREHDAELDCLLSTQESTRAQLEAATAASLKAAFSTLLDTTNGLVEERLEFLYAQLVSKHTTSMDKHSANRASCIDRGAHLCSSFIHVMLGANEV